MLKMFSSYFLQHNLDSEELLHLRPWEARVFRRTITEATPRR